MDMPPPPPPGAPVSPIADGRPVDAASPRSPGGRSDPLADVKEQDRMLPIANIARLMKQSLPENAKISKDAKEVVQECVSEFISFVTSEASDRCAADKRKTINGSDLLVAMEQLGFD
eukprot:CAMPEP_0119294716 /NCGR_PEP_ID=MMETSP1329-20130426/48551_1 /TAXON_ID=114041 /ORGANISM="Genus nov. species nov., Strain RCC1024" /LENGTH=116 /DNA_ID=CAMNT_0007295613 /DNA_START=163 /DNA_END=510 /DNA_ORIENTATION=+